MHVLLPKLEFMSSLASEKNSVLLNAFAIFIMPQVQQYLQVSP